LISPVSGGESDGGIKELLERVGLHARLRELGEATSEAVAVQPFAVAGVAG
jgi:hypothetical protein